MKTIYFLVFVLMSFTASAQLHSKYNSAIEISGGTSRFSGIRGDLGYGYFFSKRTYLKSNFFYAIDKLDKIQASHSTIGFDLSCGFTVWNYRSRFYVNLLLGPTVSYETLTSKSEKIYSGNFATLKYGGFLGVELEVSLSEKFALVANANERLTTKETFGNRRWYANLGVRIYVSNHYPVRYR